MGKVFLKLWVLVLLTSASSYLIHTHFVDDAINSAKAIESRNSTRRTFVFVEEALRGYPKAEWPARVAHMKERIGFPFELVPLSQLASTKALEPDVLARLSNGDVHVTRLTNPNGAILYRTVLGTDHVAKITAQASPEPLIFGLFRPMVFVWIVESTLFALTIMAWIALFWRDLKRIDRAAEQVGAGQFDVHVNIRGGSALRPIADSFNRMAERIGKLVNSHRDLTNAVSHELKTPLARLRFALSLAEEATPVERENLIRKMHQDVDELDSLVQEMLLYSRLERNTVAPDMALASVPVESWLPNAVEDEIEAAQAADISVPVAVQANVADAPCEPKYMARAVQNLVRNALRFAKSRVEVSVEEDRERFRIHVDDDGPGIPVADQARLFVPFARLDSSRTRQENAGGTGLGLAIVQRIAEWHGGRATISTSSLGGARITIEWPAMKAA
ncbi:MAG: ATP-binding protein [Betaproteobacteria bacterium]|nr:ATP-binding protein [Betaproteobacteria bacterium]